MPRDRGDGAPSQGEEDRGAGASRADLRPRYEPPRIVKRRALGKVTGQFSGTGPTDPGTASAPPPFAAGYG